MTSAVYLNVKESKSLEELITNTQVDLQEKVSLAAYPNPASGSFAISGEGTYRLKMYNTLGQLVYRDDNYEGNNVIQFKDKGMHKIHLQQEGRHEKLTLVLE
jgi:hypothetical protein